MVKTTLNTQRNSHTYKRERREKKEKRKNRKDKSGVKKEESSQTSR